VEPQRAAVKKNSRWLFLARSQLAGQSENPGGDMTNIEGIWLRRIPPSQSQNQMITCSGFYCLTFFRKQVSFNRSPLKNPGFGRGDHLIYLWSRRDLNPRPGKVT